VERNRKAGQNTPRVVAPVEEEEEEEAEEEEEEEEDFRILADNYQSQSTRLFIM
jgi:hypothetical protein